MTATKTAPKQPPVSPPDLTLQLRSTIIANFNAQCASCNPVSSRSERPAQRDTACERCRTAAAYTNHAVHTASFLSAMLLPISHVFSFDEMVLLLNQTAYERLANSLESGGEAGEEAHPRPTLADYAGVRCMVDAKKMVLERYPIGALQIDRFGIIQVVHRPRG
ncbi:hypothetical protein C8A01DRAFT_20347 [Parachaetomium inaequale]|uniref:Uncharacterized protein n=1 Tax=Parachaetomium inaequale TaxID=2588326 RepID=A0AAN6PAT3_9PEZI|nr:hypothetical protein C8A01DRAFT_20347 [Parachaetomium inaequale]